MSLLRPRLRGLLLAAIASAAACAPRAPTVVVPPPAPAAPAPLPKRAGGKPVMVPQSLSNPFEVAWSPDGKTLAAAANEGVLLFDPEQGAVRGVIPRSGEVDWAADGSTLVIRAPGEISSWNAATGAQRGAAVDLKGASAVAWTPAVVAVARGAAIEIFDPVSGVRRASFPAAAPSVLSVGRAGRRIAAGGKDGALQVWDVEGGQARALGKAGASLRAITLSPRETSLAAVQAKDEDTSWISIWDVEGGVERHHVEIPSGSANRVAWMPDGSAVVVSTRDKAILVRAGDGRVTEIGEAQSAIPSATGRLVGLLQSTNQYTGSTRLPPSVDVWSLDFYAVVEGATGAADIEFGMFNGPLEIAFRPGDDRIGYAYRGFYSGSGMIGVGSSPRGEGGPRSLAGSSARCEAVAWEDGGATLTTHFAGARLHWSTTGGKIVAEAVEPDPLPQVWGERDFETPPPEVDPFEPETVAEIESRSVTWFPPRRPGQGKIEIAEAGKKSIVLSGLDQHLGVSPDRRQILTVRGGALVLYHLADGKPGATIRPAPRKRFSSSDVAWSGDGATLLVGEVAPKPKTKKASAPPDGFKLWDSLTGKQLYAAADGESPRFGRLGAPPSPVLVYSGGERLVVVDARTGAERASLAGRRCWQPILEGNRVLATCRDGKKARFVLWEPGGREIPLASPPTELNVPVLSHGGAFVAAHGAAREGVFLWDAQTGALLDRLVFGERAPFAFSPDGRFLALGGDEGATLVRLADRQRLHLAERAQEGLAYTDDVLFDGSPAAAALLRARLGDDLLHADTVAFSQIADRYRRPGLVEALFTGKPLALPPELAGGLGVPPGLTLSAGSVEGDQTTVTLKVVDRGGGIEALALLVDDKPVDVPPPTAAELAGGVVERTVTVPVGPKKAAISAYATATQGSARSAPEQVTAERRARPDAGAPGKK